MITAFYLPHPSPDKAAGYAQKGLAAAQGLKKPDGVDDAAFKKDQDTQIGIAHLVLGYAALMKAGRTTKFGPITDELKNSSDLLAGNAGLQGQALYYLAFAYEKQYPANHQAASVALEQGRNLAGSLPGPVPSPPREGQGGCEVVSGSRTAHDGFGRARRNSRPSRWLTDDVQSTCGNSRRCRFQNQYTRTPTPSITAPKPASSGSSTRVFTRNKLSPERRQSVHRDTRRPGRAGAHPAECAAARQLPAPSAHRTQKPQKSRRYKAVRRFPPRP